MFNDDNHFYDFSGFRLDPAKRLLWRNGEMVPITPKALDVLILLVERRGQLLEREELLERVWKGTFVEEANLNFTISSLRKILDRNGEKLIQTVPRRGYRFRGSVHPVNGDEVIIEKYTSTQMLVEVQETRHGSEEPADKGSWRKGSRLRAALILSAVAIAAIVIGGYFFAVDRQPGRPGREIRSVAVLPLKYLDQSSKNHFSLGLTDSLIIRLGRLNRFAVRPYSSVENYEKSGKDAIGFGRELQVDAVVEGTIQNSADRLRVNLRLIEIETGNQIWSDSFDETEADILKLQDSISNRVARALVTKLRPHDEELLAKKPTEDPEAYRLYLAGRDRWLQRNGKTESLAFYKKAIEMDPNFALPYLGIADEYAFTYETQIAEDALAKAIELDPTLAEAHATKGFLKMFHYWDWQGAERSFLRALELAPNSSKAHHWYGVYLSIRGRFEEAQREMENALEIDPTALVIMSDIAELHYFRHDYDQAETELMKALAIDPTFVNARLLLIKVRAKKGASYFLEEADFNVFLQNKRKADGLAQDYDPAELEQIVARGDERTLRDNTRRALEKTNRNKPANYLELSRFYSIVGEKERSLDALEKALEAKVFVIPFVAVDPLWEPVRGEPRFQEILRKMNLSD